jgi:enoyl-CoA hydratase/carnithine racemase
VTGLTVQSPQPGVALVVLDKPGRLNALDEPMMRTLPTLLETLAGDPEVRVVVLTGAGGAFSAGGDLAAIGALPLLGHDELEAHVEHCFQASVLLHGMDKPTIAAVSGPAAGGALGLALACDYRLGGRDAAFVCPFINMGIPPDYGLTWLLPRAIGLGPALEMALTGRRVRADEALALGLVHRLCDDPLTDALSLAAKIAARSPAGVALTTRLMRESASRDLPAGVRVEAQVQRDALHRPEFTERWSDWQAAVTGT